MSRWVVELLILILLDLCKQALYTTETYILRKRQDDSRTQRQVQGVNDTTNTLQPAINQFQSLPWIMSFSRQTCHILTSFIEAAAVYRMYNLMIDSEVLDRLEVNLSNRFPNLGPVDTTGEELARQKIISMIAGKVMSVFHFLMLVFRVYPWRRGENGEEMVETRGEEQEVPSVEERERASNEYEIDQWEDIRFDGEEDENDQDEGAEHGLSSAYEREMMRYCDFYERYYDTSE